MTDPVSAAPLVVVLTGVTGAGKTTVGTLLAAELGWPFYDADDFHAPEHVAQMRAGVALDDADRAGWLSRLATLVRDLLDHGRSAVLACSALREAYRARIAGGDPRVVFVFLTGSPALIRRRLAARRDHFAGADLLPSQLRTLELPADAIVVDVSPPPAVLAQQIRRALGR